MSLETLGVLARLRMIIVIKAVGSPIPSFAS